jgi:hypothetical protein
MQSTPLRTGAGEREGMKSIIRIALESSSPTDAMRQAALEEHSGLVNHYGRMREALGWYEDPSSDYYHNTQLLITHIKAALEQAQIKEGDQP